MPETETHHFKQQFTNLRVDTSANWGAVTTGRAPHKPLLLLSVMDLFAQGSITHNLIEVTPDLIDLFARYWSLVIPERRGTLVLPFFHLRSSDFWQLIPQPEKEEALAHLHTVSSYTQLQKYTIGARLDDALYTLMCVPESRELLRTVLIQEYFAPEVQPLLVEQGTTNREAFHYSQRLLEKARRGAQESPAAEEEYQPAVRDQGFRRAVTMAYDQRCAFCGIRVQTPEGHTAVDAAHIIPWSISHNDDPGNGMALCRLCHWTFDEGLLGVSDIYRVIHSPLLGTTPNFPGLLSALSDRQIFRPEEERLWPDLDALGWHRAEVLRGE